MASSVYYRWRSRKDDSRITFDGTGISVFELKKEIILANNMAKANDYDLYCYDSATNREYEDDMEMIPRSSYVIVKRMPALRPGKGKASYYTAGTLNALPTSDPITRPGGGSWHRGAMSKRFDGKDESQTLAKAMVPEPNNSVIKEQDDEDAAMAAMFQAQSANWEETQEKMSHQQRVAYNARGGFRGGARPSGGPSHQAFQGPERALPPSYVCYRCGQKGHWIKDCPTNNDREFDHKPRIKRTTGIPRSMLKAVENPNSTGQIGPGIMVTPEGGYVVAQPDSAAWQKQVSKIKALTASDVRDRVPADSSLACGVDNKLFRDAVKTPCCGTPYCEECIQTHLLERDFVCPSCSKKIPSLDTLIADEPLRARVNEYIEAEVEKSKVAVEGDVPGEDDNVALDGDFYSDQPGDLEMIVNSIPQLQAEVNQLSVMLHKSSLPAQVRQTTEIHFQQAQMRLQQAQAMQAAFMQFSQQIQAGMGGNWQNSYGR
ncbi:DWNN-domain-containing protein [Cylindrobasidium torrendii FP15055 ss-10]|uniref:DWNN-domain-containing protein n=1 Tax=Cylindrobasidium torrendii FP15055 ss-10 TaxID=1314674 RepID=A0A0D7B5L8_9AGAR|nr:DWNN-domain-containing protein [Cylindrobasidium torrendii FP15055 ss-10]